MRLSDGILDEMMQKLARAVSRLRLSRAVSRMSIRARVAFGLVGVERAARRLGLEDPWLDGELQGLWRYTEANDLSWWNCSADAEYLAEVFSRATPRERLEMLARMLNALDEIGGGNLFGGFQNEFTHTPTMDLAAIVAEQGVLLPPTKPFVKISPRRPWDAWGKSFNVAEMRRRLDQAESSQQDGQGQVPPSR